MADIIFPDGTILADLVGNRNVYSADPATSKGGGEIIYQSTAGVLKVNTQTVDPTTNPTWTGVGSGGWVGAATSGLDMNGYAITEAAMAGTNSATFVINQDNAGIESSAIKFDRGSESTEARIIWSETNDRFDFESVSGTTLATMRAAQLDVSGQINLDDTVGTIIIKEDDATGDMVLQVASGDAIVFKAV